MPRSRPRRASSSNAMILAMQWSSRTWDTWNRTTPATAGCAGPRPSPGPRSLIARSGTHLQGVLRRCLALLRGECKPHAPVGRLPSSWSRPTGGSAFSVGASHLLGLGAFLALRDLELDPLALVETLVTLHLDRAVVHEDVGTVVHRDEAVTLLRVEPLHASLGHS